MSSAIPHTTSTPHTTPRAKRVPQDEIEGKHGHREPMHDLGSAEICDETSTDFAEELALSQPSVGAHSCGTPLKVNAIESSSGNVVAITSKRKAALMEGQLRFLVQNSPQPSPRPNPNEDPGVSPGTRPKRRRLFIDVDSVNMPTPTESTKIKLNENAWWKTVFAKKPVAGHLGAHVHGGAEGYANSPNPSPWQSPATSPWPTSGRSVGSSVDLDLPLLTASIKTVPTQETSRSCEILQSSPDPQCSRNLFATPSWQISQDLNCSLPQTQIEVKKNKVFGGSLFSRPRASSTDSAETTEKATHSFSKSLSASSVSSQTPTEGRGSDVSVPLVLFQERMKAATQPQTSSPTLSSSSPPPAEILISPLPTPCSTSTPGKESLDQPPVFSWGVSTFRNLRKTNDDRYSVSTSSGPDAPTTFYGVFDGHGGSKASEFCTSRLFTCIQEQPSFGTDPIDAIVKGFVKTDKEFNESSASKRVNGLGGTTAIVCIATGKTLIVANTGDSKAVLLRGDSSVALSREHRPSRPDEKARVEAAGGGVSGNRVDGILSMTRAIGNAKLKGYIIAEPEVQQHQVDQEDHFLILATDGLWDTISNNKARRIVGSLPAQEAADRLVEEAVGAGSKDNITALVIDLRPEGAQQKSAEQAKQTASSSLPLIYT